MSETLLPRLLLSRYRVEDSLGEGGLGTVIKAYDVRLRRHVAIKTIRREVLSADPQLFADVQERFRREAIAGSRTHGCPYLVTVYDQVEDADGTLYLILEYLPGGTLRDLLTRGPVPLSDALRLTAEAARGLRVLHENGIVHRDIKPANIFLAADGRAEVGDFGIVQLDDLSSRSRVTRGHPGTEAYMAPEQSETTGYITPEADQYSLGLVLFELLTGKRFRRLHTGERDALFAALPPAVGNVVQRMTAREPGDRYPGMGAVVDAIVAVQARADIAATEQLAGANEALSTLPTTMPPGIHDGPPTAPNTPPLPASLAPPAGMSFAATMPPTPAPQPMRRRAMLLGVCGAVAAGATGGVVFMARGGGGGQTATATSPPPATSIPAVATTAPLTAPPATPTALMVANIAGGPATAPPMTVAGPPTVLPTTAPPTAAPPTAVQPTAPSPTSVLPTTAPPTAVPPTALPPTMPPPAPTATPAPPPTPTRPPAPSATRMPPTAVPTPAYIPPRPLALLRLGEGGHGYGFNVWGLEPSDAFRTGLYKSVRDAGFGWVRQTVNWGAMEQSKGNFGTDFTKSLDDFVAGAAAQGLKVLLSVGRSPDWAGAGGGLLVKPNEFRDFMDFLTRRYLGQVQAYEIWGIQNLASQTASRINVGGYLPILRTAYETIKKFDPNIAVVFGGLSPTAGGGNALNDIEYLRQIYALNGGEVKQYYDILGTHVYGNCNPPDSAWPANPPTNACGRDGDGSRSFTRDNAFYFARAAEQRRVMEEAGEGGKQVWVTEFGWGIGPYISEDEQARYLTRAFEIGKSLPWVGGMFPWNLNYATISQPSDEPSQFSLIRRDGTPRPGFTALQRLQK